MECKNQRHPIVGIEGFASAGKQFDLDITIPEDNRDVIYGIVKDCYKNPVCDAVVKLIEVDKECRENRKPVSHTFTDKHGEFVFGPLCPHKFYTIEIWANKVEHIKICAKCNREGRCLKGMDIGPCDYYVEDEHRPEKPCCKEYDKPCYKEDYKEECKSCCKDHEKEDCKPCYKDHEKEDYKPCCKEHEKEDCKPCCKKDCEENGKKECKPVLYLGNNRPYCR